MRALLVTGPGRYGLADLPERLPNHTTGGGTATFNNPLSLHGPDPWLTYYNGFYYLVTTTWNSTITMRRATTLRALSTTPDTVIYNLSQHPNACCNMWAPEIHLLTGPNGTRWYLYFTAGQNVANYLGTQRIHVLESAGLDPMGPYTFKASLLDPTQNNTWELDGSILQLNGNNSTSGGCDMNRTTRAQKFTWNADGTPNLGIPVSLSTTLTAPSGEPAQ